MSSVTRRDYYEILGVERECDDGVIKTAYRKLAMQFHPDRNPGSHEAEERFKEAAEAYSVLSDPQKRAAYNRFWSPGRADGGGQRRIRCVGIPGSVRYSLSDVFRIRRRVRTRRPATKTVESAARRRRPLRPRNRGFEDLDGGGLLRGYSASPRMEAVQDAATAKARSLDDGLVTCPMCRGRGEVIYQQAFLSVRRTCSQCSGRGQIIRRPCKECRGEGYLRRERKLKVNIPAGVDNGTQLRLSQEGQPGANSGPAGDLYVVLKVAEHPIFERHESDLHRTVPINIGQAALGGVDRHSDLRWTTAPHQKFQKVRKPEAVCV